MKKLLIILLLFCSIISQAQKAEHIYEIGKKLYEKEKYTEAITKFEFAAEQGYPKAQYRLGRMYAKGQGVKKDYVKAVFWYEKAAAQGHAKSQYYLGKCYMKAKGVKEDKAKAKELISRAVKHKKKGTDIFAEIKKDAQKGKKDAKEILKLIE